MTGTMLRVHWIRFKRDRAAIFIQLTLPIAFFTILTLILGDLSGFRVRLAAVDEDRSTESASYLAALVEEGGLSLVQAEDGVALDRTTAERLGAIGQVQATIVIPPGFGAALSQTGSLPAASDAALEAEVELRIFQLDPMVEEMLDGLLQITALEVIPDLLTRRALDVLREEGGPLSARQAEAWGDFQAAAGADPADPDDDGAELLEVEVAHAVGSSEDPMTVYYAAGYGVLFLLFMVSGATGALLDEAENGVLERLLSSKLGMGRILLAKWIAVALLGIVQVTLMFIYGSFVFGIDLWTPRHLSGFLVMTVLTAAGASALGMLLATLCRSRAQMAALSAVFVLMMSALGGSMVPRFLMPEWLQTAGLLTFNAWALDGYRKVFLEDSTLLGLWPQLAVLAGVTVGLLILARVFARRWEHV